MSYQDAVNAFAYRRAAQDPHFRRGPGPIRGGTTVTIKASEVELLQSEDVVARKPYSVEVDHELIDWSVMGSPMLNHDPAFKNHDIDYSADAKVEGTIIEGFYGSDVTPPEPDVPAVEVTVRCGTCGENVTMLASLTDTIRGVLDTGK